MTFGVFQCRHDVVRSSDVANTRTLTQFRNPSKAVAAVARIRPLPTFGIEIAVFEQLKFKPLSGPLAEQKVGTRKRRRQQC
jgi:hypothetical protein